MAASAVPGWGKELVSKAISAKFAAPGGNICATLLQRLCMMSLVSECWKATEGPLVVHHAVMGSHPPNVCARDSKKASKTCQSIWLGEPIFIMGCCSKERILCSAC